MSSRGVQAGPALPLWTRAMPAPSEHPSVKGCVTCTWREPHPGRLLRWRARVSLGDNRREVESCHQGPCRGAGLQVQLWVGCWPDRAARLTQACLHPQQPKGTP